MRRGWQVELINGSIIEEGQMEWREVPKVKIKTLSLLYDGRRWDLFGKSAYFIKNKASMVPGVVASFKIEQRCIGYYDGAKKIHYIVDEATGKFNMEVVDNGEG
jgi:hypothetical protein